MAPGDVCHGPRCSLAGLGPVALQYRSCHWPGGSGGSSQCVRRIECWFFPVPRPPYVCAVSWVTWLLLTGVPAWFVVLCLRCAVPFGSCSLVCPPGVLCCVCGVLGHLAPVQQCARVVCCFACLESWATCLLFVGAPARYAVLRVQCPGPFGSCSLVFPLGVLCCVCGVLGDLAPVHWCARWVHCFACTVSMASWLLFTSVSARCAVLCVRFPGPLGSCSPVCPLGVLCCLWGVLGHLPPVHRCARSVCCFACAVSWATWLLCTGVPAWFVVLRVRCPGQFGSCSPVCRCALLCLVCAVLGHLAPVHRCSRSLGRVACAVSRATWLPFTGVPAWFVVLRVLFPGPLGSCSRVCLLSLLCCVCGVLGHSAPVHRCACSVGYVVCAPSWAIWLQFTGVAAWFDVLHVRCPGPGGSCSPVCPLGALLCVCGLLGQLAPLHRCARSVCCGVSAVSLASWLLFTSVPVRCVALCLRCSGPLGSCSPVRLLCPLLCFCRVLGHLAPVYQCAPSVCCFLRVGCPGRLSSCSPVCALGVLCCVWGVLGRLAPVHQCARSVRCVARAASWATWLSFAGVPAWCVVLSVPCPGPLGSCSPVCLLGVFCWVCGVLGHLTPVHWCAHSVLCFAYAVSWATWLLFTGAPAPCVVVLRVRCPGPLGSCSPVYPLRPLLCSCGVLVVLSSCTCDVGCCVLCALSGFAAPGGRCCLAHVRVPWLWPAACLSGVPRGPAWCAAPRPVWSLSVLRLAIPTPW